MIDSNSESVLSFFKNNRESEIPEEIQNSNEYINLYKEAGVILNFREKGGDFNNDLLNFLLERFRKNTEPEFRSYLRAYLNNSSKTKKERIKVFYESNEYDWIKQMYPATLIGIKQIIFMSIDKFVSRFSGIIDNPVYLFESNYIKDSIIFIDEIDDAKQRILNRIVENKYYHQFHLIQLFLRINAVLNNTDFPNDLLISDNQRSNKIIIDSLKKKSNEINYKFSLNWIIKKSEEIEGNRIHIFNDINIYVETGHNKDRLALRKNEDANINEIYIDSNNTQNAKLSDLTFAINSFMKYFAKCVLSLSKTLIFNKNRKESKLIELMTPDEACDSILDLFNLADEEKRFMKELMQDYSKEQNENTISEDFSVYENGFKRITLTDDIHHDLVTKINQLSLRVTPEKILLKMCERAKVLGTSATAYNDSVITNFDLNYIKFKLQDKFFALTETQTDRLKESYRNFTKGYDKIKINVEAISIGSDVNFEINALYENDEVRQAIVNRLRFLFSTRDTWIWQRYLRVVSVYKHFLLKDGIDSMLCVMNRFPKPDDKQFDESLLFFMFRSLIEDMKMDKSVKDSVVILKGTNFERNVCSLKEKLKSGGKIFVLTSYPTILTGVNLQYPINENLKNKLICINDEKPTEYKDFDAIYLDQRTNIKPSSIDLSSITNLVKYILQVEMLFENAEITLREYEKLIRNAMLVGDKNSGVFNLFKFSNLRSIRSAYLKDMNQIIGRMGRTNLKSPEIYIFYDIKLKDQIGTTAKNKYLINPEFENFLNHINIETTEDEPQLISLIERAKCSVNRSRIFINKHITHDWNKKKITSWRNMRRTVLKYPTCTRKEYDSIKLVRNCYIQLPYANNKIYYKKTGDFSATEVKFEQKNCESVLSEQVAKLSEIRKIKMVKDFFEKQSWPLYFHKNEFILSPQLFYNIYLGALGENIGRLIFEEFLSIKLDEIEEISYFEKFDFFIHDRNIGVDFKFWNVNIQKDNHPMLEKIAAKAKLCSLDGVIVANIFKQGEYKCFNCVYDGIRILTIDHLIDEKSEFNNKLYDYLKEFLEG